MEVRKGILAGVAERVLAMVGFVLVIGVGYAIYKVPADTKMAIWSSVWRSIFWVVLAAGVPWTAKLFIKRVIEVGHNWAGLVLIAALTLADAIIGMILMTAWPSGGWTWFAALGALGVAATYNYLVTEYLAEMEGG